MLAQPENGAFLASIQLDYGGTKGYFEIMDDNRSNAVSKSEFISCYLRLKGHAKVIDVAKLQLVNDKKLSAEIE